MQNKSLKQCGIPREIFLGDHKALIFKQPLSIPTRVVSLLSNAFLGLDILSFQQAAAGRRVPELRSNGIEDLP